MSHDASLSDEGSVFAVVTKKYAKRPHQNDFLVMIMNEKRSLLNIWPATVDNLEKEKNSQEINHMLNTIMTSCSWLDKKYYTNRSRSHLSPSTKIPIKPFSSSSLKKLQNFGYSYNIGERKEAHQGDCESEKQTTEIQNRKKPVSSFLKKRFRWDERKKGSQGHGSWSRSRTNFVQGRCRWISHGAKLKIHFQTSYKFHFFSF